MNQNFEAYAFLIEREYPKLKDWYAGRISTSRLGLVRTVVERAQPLIIAWLEHNLAHERQVSDIQAPCSRPPIGFLAFWDQWRLVNRTPKN